MSKNTDNENTYKKYSNKRPTKEIVDAEEISVPEVEETVEAAEEIFPDAAVIEKKDEVKETSFPTRVKMRFSEHKFYNDLNNPIYLKGEIYDIEGADKIQRWLLRGGEIIEDIAINKKSGNTKDKDKKISSK